ncbi:MAG: short-chain dehydrogenase [Micrococcales bacterium]|nr:MAG: short-chain dehydrogenase [Micrococcales bacterium]
MGTALVTGATAGIGYEFARQLAESGHDVVLVARDRERLEKVAAELSTTYGVAADPRPADLTDPGQLGAVAERVRAQDDPIEILVNNAGFGNKHRFLDTDLDQNTRMIDLLVTATTVLCHAGGRAMRDRGRGAMITVSSIAGFVSSGIYSANKAYQTTLTESLAEELRPYGVAVTALCPGFTRTEFHDRMDLQRVTVPDWAWLQADHLVAQALSDTDAGKVLSIPGMQYKAVAALTRIAPRSALRRQSRSRD